MITFTARVKMIQGKEEDALDVAKKLVESVQKEEPGALAYICHQCEENPQELLFFEVYADEVAAEVHGKTPHFNAFKKQFGKVFDADFGAKIEYLERVEGFFRDEDE